MVNAHILESSSALSLRTQDPGAELCCISLQQLFYNDEETTATPKRVITKHKTLAELKSFLREGFEVPANKSVTLTFKPAGEEQKQCFWDKFVQEQLSIAIAVHVDDV